MLDSAGHVRVRVQLPLVSGAGVTEDGGLEHGLTAKGHFDFGGPHETRALGHVVVLIHDHIIEKPQQPLMPIAHDDRHGARQGGQFTTLTLEVTDEVGSKPGQLPMNPGEIVDDGGAPEIGGRGEQVEVRRRALARTGLAGHVVLPSGRHGSAAGPFDAQPFF
jgi:hypothetical protein